MCLYKSQCKIIQEVNKDEKAMGFFFLQCFNIKSILDTLKVYNMYPILPP